MKQSALMLLIGLAFAAQADPEVKMISEFGFIVENQIDTTASSDQVWTALIEDVDSWWPKDHSWWGQQGKFSIDSKAGGCFCETSGNKSAEHMHIAFVDPHKTLRMTGGLGPLQGMGMFGALDWQFESLASGTRVTLTYKVNGVHPGGFKELAPIVANVQSQQLNGLKQFVERK